MTKKDIAPIPVQSIVPPSLKALTPIHIVAGANPPLWRLLDHAELDGIWLIANQARFGESPTTGATFALVDAWFTAMSPIEQPDQELLAENHHLLYTTAENVVQRLLVAEAAKAWPVVGKLRKSTRAWFLD